ncbi:hypothetical protein [Psychrobacillus sp. FSL H8-0487]|uniref:hypothetical protein n=1 Tax=Psychrobacillus sp. FSL H8-0487 TaxID=2921391 RepID=UPI0030F4C706
MVKIIFFSFVIAFIILLCKTKFFSSMRKFRKTLLHYYNQIDIPAEKRKTVYKEYKTSLKQFDQLYTRHYDYLTKDHKIIFKCKYLVKYVISPSFKNDFVNACAEYDDTNIREEAIEKIKDCLYKQFVFLSAIEYFEDHIDYAYKTSELISKNKRGSYLHLTYYKPLVWLRIKYLENIIIQCERIIDFYESKIADIDAVIAKLERIKKPTLLGIAFNVITAPIRHTFNLVDSLFTGDKEKLVKSTTMIGVSFIGIGIIGEAIDAFDFFDTVGVDLSSIDGLDSDLHHVDSHSVESYVRGDGTFVSGYERGGEDGYFRTDPDDSLINNFRS